MSHLPRLLSLSIAIAVLSACSSLSVQELPKQHLAINHICIVDNPKVTITEFVPALQARLNHHGIGNTVINPKDEGQCTHTLKYVARRSWDFTTYLSEVDLKLFEHQKQIAFVSFKQGSGSLAKWGGTADKLNPLVDKMLGQSQPKQPQSNSNIHPQATPTTPTKTQPIESNGERVLKPL